MPIIPHQPDMAAARGRLARRLLQAASRAWAALWRWLLRWGLVVLGVLIVMFGLMLGPLPGPGGIPIVALGLILILRGSITARRGFARLHRRYPRYLGPVRRVLRWRLRRGSRPST